MERPAEVRQSAQRHEENRASTALTLYGESINALSTAASTETRLQRLKEHVWSDVDPNQSNFPLAMYCFMTGFIDALTFTAVSVWSGFQTGNTIELSLALARLFDRKNSPGPSFRVIDQQSLTSILSFLFGAFIGRIGDRMGCKTRLWLFIGTMIQALMTMASAILLWKGHESSFSGFGPTWIKPEGFAALALASASMGLQGIIGKRVNTQFATTIVLTTVWCELMAEPSLFTSKLVKTRDLKVIAVTALFIGGFTGRALIDKIGDASTFAIGTGFRVIIAFFWLVTPTKPKPKRKASRDLNKV